MVMVSDKTNVEIKPLWEKKLLSNINGVYAPNHTNWAMFCFIYNTGINHLLKNSFTWLWGIKKKEISTKYIYKLRRDEDVMEQYIFQAKL